MQQLIPPAGEISKRKGNSNEGEKAWPSISRSYPPRARSRRFQFCTVHHRMADNSASRGLFVIQPRRSPLLPQPRGHLGDHSSLSPTAVPFFQATLAVVEQASHLHRYTTVSLNAATCTSLDVCGQIDRSREL